MYVPHKARETETYMNNTHNFPPLVFSLCEETVSLVGFLCNAPFNICNSLASRFVFNLSIPQIVISFFLKPLGSMHIIGKKSSVSSVLKVPHVRVGFTLTIQHLSKANKSTTM